METTFASKRESDKKTATNSPPSPTKTAPRSEIGAPAGLPLFLQRSPDFLSAPPDIQLQEEEEEELLQMMPAAGLSKSPGGEYEGGNKGSVRAKLMVGAPDDEYEREADRVADTVMRMPDKKFPECKGKKEIQTKPTNIAFQRQPIEEEEELLQPKTNATSSNHTSQHVATTIQSPTGGSPLPTSVKNKVGPVLNTDFSHVRVHNDANANNAARDLNAKAFTHQNNIYLGKGQSVNDLRLMAHESTHVVQQRGNKLQTVIRASLRERETTGISFQHADIEKEVVKSYWENKVGKRFKLIYVTPVINRFNLDKEERDAVLSILWKESPKGKIKRAVTRLVSIPARAGVKSSKSLIYKFTYKPKKKKQKKHNVEVEFVMEGGAKKVSVAPVPSAGFTPSTPALSHIGFPKNNYNAYFKAHPDEHKQLFNWIENVAPNKFEQVVTTSETKVKGKRSITRKSSFKVVGTKSTTGITGLLIYFLASLIPKAATPSAGYKDKDYIDLELERLQGRKKKPLGKITGLVKLPADERSSVKYAIWQYFKAGKTRNAEVDLILPIANTKRSVYYTLRFQPKTNDVYVELIGEEGKKTGKVKPNKLDLARVKGYKANAKDSATLIKWLKVRYPGISPTGKNVDEIRKDVNKTMETDAGKPGWFKKNYKIYILNASNGDTHMKDVHNWLLAGRADIKDYTDTDLKKLEFALQTMTIPILTILKETRMVRQKIYLKKQRGVFVEKPKQSGLAVTKGTDKTIIIFDNYSISDNILFVGGKEGVRAESSTTFAHELGHLVGFSSNIIKKFNAFVKKPEHGIKPVSWYAAQKPAKEFFPEAFAFYQLDPEWMKNNQPKLYTWFETLSKTGTPP